jgi:hypothetical protein
MVQPLLKLAFEDSRPEAQLLENARLLTKDNSKE